MLLYGYVNNDPMNNNDPTGEKISIGSTVEEREDGTTLTIVEINFTASLEISGGNLPAGMTEADLATSLETSIEQAYSQTYTDADGNVVEYRAQATIGVGPATGDEHSIEYTAANDSRLAAGGAYALGAAPGFDNGNTLLISEATFTSNDPKVSFERTGAHEFGHLAGLRHPNDPNNTIQGLPTANLMSQTRYSASRNVERSQLRAIFKNTKFR